MIVLFGCSQSSSKISTDADCSKGGPCKLGDIGPGGGVVFLVDYEDQYAGFTYLEIKYEDMIDNSGLAIDAVMCNNLFVNMALNSNRIGRGRINTEELALICENGPASIVKKFSQNSFADWYLPTSDELQRAYEVLAVNGLLNFAKETNSVICSSSYSNPGLNSLEASHTIGVILNPNVAGIAGNSVELADNQKCALRPVRSFG